MVNYYRDMWPKCSNLLAPLSSLTLAKVKWKWTEEHQKSFDQKRALRANEVLLTFPDCNMKSEIHADASMVQLGACISQKGTSSLQPAQTRYTITERELLFTVENLKEF